MLGRQGAGMPGTPPRSAPGGYFNGQDGGDFLSMFNPQGGFNSQAGFGGKHDLDMSAFPALGQQLQRGPNLTPSNYPPTGLSFGAMTMGKSGAQREEFNMLQDEFPALPGASKPKASPSPSSQSPMLSPMQPMSQATSSGEPFPAAAARRYQPASISAL